jgi:hypothetical protein
MARAGMMAYALRHVKVDSGHEKERGRVLDQ